MRLQWTGCFAGGGGSGRPMLRGRPAGLAVAIDGSLLIADDVANAIWRVSRTE